MKLKEFRDTIIKKPSSDTKWSACDIANLNDIFDQIFGGMYKKKLCLHKAYLNKDGEEMDLPTDGEILYGSPERAIQALLNSTDIDLNGKLITMLTVLIPYKDNPDVEIGEDYYNKETGGVSVVLKDMVYSLEVTDAIVNHINYSVEEETGRKLLKQITYTITESE